jgi:hypothetical protein
MTSAGPVPQPSPAQIEAFDAGVAAYQAGLDSRAVLDVYPSGSENRLLWVRGYVLTRRNDLYGPPEED